MMDDGDQSKHFAALGDLREFLRISSERNELEIIRGADPQLEMGALCELSLKHTYPPVLLFEKIKGCDPRVRVISNVRTSPMFVGRLDLDAVKKLRRNRKGEKSQQPIPPREVNTGPVMENIRTGDDVDVNLFPAPVWHEEDGGPYIGTECLVIARDPDSGWVNAGTYRVQVHGKKILSVFIEPGQHGDLIRRKYWKRGKACPLVITVGQAPILGGTARTAIAPEIDEFAIAGGQLGQAIEVIPAPITGLPIPANAELAFEGFMPPPSEETCEEGPFGERPGYYASKARPASIFRVEAIYHRDDPIIIGQPPMLPTYPGRQTHLAGVAAIWDALEQAGIPGIKGVWKMLGGGTRFINVIAIDQQFAGHAKMVGLAATSCGPAAFMGRMTIVVDEDIDITRPAEVLWAMSTRWDPKDQTDIIDGCWTGYLDPTVPPDKREPGNMTNSRIIIYAVRPFHWRNSFPKVNRVERAYAEEIRTKWRERLDFLGGKSNAPEDISVEPARLDRRAALGDLREFLRQTESAGELRIVTGADPHLEMGALFELSLEHLYPPVLMFDEIKGYPPGYRVVSNVRTAKFMVGDLDLEAVVAYRQRPQEKSKPIPPEEISTGPVLENILKGKKVNVLKFPAPKWHMEDGGNYIGTECIVITKDPDSEWVNIGTYRVQVQDEKTLSVFIEPGKHGDLIRKKYWEQNQPCPMAVCVGQAPILGIVAAAAARHGESEYALAGGRIGRAIQTVRGELTGLPIPADGELVFEGEMYPPEVDGRPEGPFGEWPGYYASGARKEPVLRVGAIYHRNNPVIIGQPPAMPTYPGRQVKIPRVAALWDAIEAAGVPEIKGVWKLPEGGSRFIDVISINQMHAGHAKMVGLVAAGCGPGAYLGRMTIVVDDDIDITDTAQVMWALATRWDPKTQTDIIDGCWTGHIDPSLSPEKRDKEDLTTSRMIIYAVRPFHWKDEFPKVNRMEPKYAETVRRKWSGKLRFLEEAKKK